MATDSAQWSVWFYKPGSWSGSPIYFGNAEGCTRTLLIGTHWTGCIVFGLWRMRFAPDCPECVNRTPRPALVRRTLNHIRNWLDPDGLHDWEEE